MGGEGEGYSVTRLAKPEYMMRGGGEILEHRVVRFTVNCPLYPFSKWKMEIVLAKNDSGWLPLPCNGCDMLGGDPTCQKCCAALTLMFYHNPDMDVTAPVSPKIWELIDYPKNGG